METHQGAVEIHGMASSAAEKDLVTHMVRGIQGVVAVDNQMKVQSGG